MCLLPQDVQEYVSLVCSGFLANVSLVIQSCYDMFVKRPGARWVTVQPLEVGRAPMTSWWYCRKTEDKMAAEDALKNLTSFVSALMERCLSSVGERLKREAYHLESVQLVRALDRVSGKLRAMDQLLPSAELNRCVRCGC